MFWRIATALGVFIVVAIVCELIGKLLVGFNQQSTTIVGNFLRDGSLLIGLVCGIAYALWGKPISPRPRV